MAKEVKPKSVKTPKTKKNTTTKKPVAKPVVPKKKACHLELLVPAEARIVFGGPVIEKNKYPFGFTVKGELSKDELETYGVGKGVTLHSKFTNPEEGDLFTYKVVYK